jgi:hypothetical protein
MNQPDPTRPRELALLLLAASGRPPRERARDQQADRAGMQLRQQILERLIELDPDVEQLEATLLRIVDEMGPPSGPWQCTCAMNFTLQRANPDSSNTCSATPSMLPPIGAGRNRETKTLEQLVFQRGQNLAGSARGARATRSFGR